MSSYKTVCYKGINGLSLSDLINNKKYKNFLKFIECAGAEILQPTNEYEVFRFKANNQTGIIYTNKHGALRLTGESEKAWDAFINKNPYSANEVKKRVKKNNILNTLLKRDGTKCFYCGEEIEQGRETIEHLFSVNQGGSNHIANLALAHFKCNALASHLPIVKKVELRDEIRKKQQLQQE